ncbi:hypothetical protein B0H17DRAFT_1182999 [Mycena rosella]|uniref:Uncharacterized protein n=1 Tax=Mycena rosella TaxID=1033263 RepID=A0AAD7D1W5_MYCRO|nr:hypothetical protein B0H17DRAFT_1182999 [Mycena rosella]
MPPSHPSTGRRLAALFDTPSSPLGSPSSNGPPGFSSTPPGSPGGVPVTPTPAGPRTSSSPYASAGVTRCSRGRGLRTGAEDLTQFGALTARKLKLKPHSVVKLEEFAKDATSKSEVTIFGHVLHLEEMQALLVPTATSFVIPKKFENKLNIHGLRTMLSPTLYAYVKKAGADSPSLNSPSHPTEEQLEDKAVWDPVSSRLRHRLTDHRYDIKKMITDSIWVSVKTEDGETTFTEREDPLDIIKLCEALVELVPDATIKVTLPMLGRVAILRQVLFDVGSAPKYWEKVDEQLAKLCERFADDEAAEAKIFRAIAKVLNMMHIQQP